MLVTLIGYRATGKTTLAKQIAAGLGWPWNDADAMIESRTGRTIAEIFQQDGEDVFRDLEEDALRELTSGQKPMVLSVGGGALLRRASRQRIRDAGLVIWLRARPETMIRRMQSDQGHALRRPALTQLPLEEEIRSTLAQRTPVYREMADLAIETDDRPLADVTADAVAFVESHDSSCWKREM